MRLRLQTVYLGGEDTNYGTWAYIRHTTQLQNQTNGNYLGVAKGVSTSILYFRELIKSMKHLPQIEAHIKESAWWQQAAKTIDNHHSNSSGVMLTHHLQQVYLNIAAIFQQPETGFYGELFALLAPLQLNKLTMLTDLKIVALLHDIGKTREDKSILIPHPLTGKQAHKRHGLVSLIASMEILGQDLANYPERRDCIYRTIELHDISYGLFREFNATGDIPQTEHWNHINNKIHTVPAAGILYLLIFKLADIHGHANINDVLWFFNTAKENYFNQLHIDLPIPTEADIR